MQIQLETKTSFTGGIPGLQASRALCRYTQALGLVWDLHQLRPLSLQPAGIPAPEPL